MLSAHAKPVLCSSQQRWLAGPIHFEVEQPHGLAATSAGMGFLAALRCYFRKWVQQCLAL